MSLNCLRTSKLKVIALLLLSIWFLNMVVSTGTMYIVGKLKLWCMIATHELESFESVEFMFSSSHINYCKPKYFIFHFPNIISVYKRTRNVTS